MAARDAARRLRRHPTYAAAAIAILALGIGINTSVFEAADAVLIRSRPFVQPDRVFALENAPILHIGPQTERHRPEIDDWQTEHEVFESVAGFARGAGNVRSALGLERANVALVTPRFLSVIGRSPALGRAFRPGDEIPRPANVALISDGLWRREFGASASAVGAAMEISGRQYTVIGVMPPDFRYPAETDVWLPLTVPLDFSQFDFMRVAVKETVIARVRSGSSRARVQAAVDAVVSRSSGQVNAGEDRILVVPIREELSKGRRATFALLAGMGLLLLFVSVANVANLLLARATTRVDEIRVRAALGASGVRIASELMTEPLILAAIGGIAGVVLANWMLGALIGLHVVTNEEVAAGRLGVWTLAFVALLTLASGLLAGGTSTIALRRAVDRSPLTTYSGRGGGHARARKTLLAAQLALAFVLVTGSTLLARSLRAALDQDADLRMRALTAELSLAPALFPTTASRARVADAILERLRRNPQVRRVGIVSNLPLSGGAEVLIPFRASGARSTADGILDLQAEYEAVSPGYFAAMEIPMSRGRDFSTMDVAGAPPVAIINEDLADRFWPGANPIGSRIAYSGDSTQRLIVGVVRTVRAFSLTRRSDPQVYYPFAQAPSKNFGVVIDASADEGDMARILRDDVRDADPSVPVYHIRTFEQVRLDSVAPQSSRAILLGAFAVLALVLACAGVYGTTSYLVADRTREIGVRIALGAPRQAIIGLTMREGMRAALLGIPIGVASALALGRIMSAVLYGVTGTDPFTFVSAAIGLFLLAALSALVPGVRALRVDPVRALRHE